MLRMGCNIFQNCTLSLSPCKHIKHVIVQIKMLSRTTLVPQMLASKQKTNISITHIKFYNTSILTKSLSSILRQSSGQNVGLKRQLA